MRMLGKKKEQASLGISLAGCFGDTQGIKPRMDGVRSVERALNKELFNGYKQKDVPRKNYKLALPNNL